MNVAFHWTRTPWQGQGSSHRCFIALQLCYEVMERRFTRCFPPGQPGRSIAFPQHAKELFGEVHGKGKVGRAGTEGLRQALLGRRWILDEVKQQGTGLSWTGTSPGWRKLTRLRAPAYPQPDAEPLASCGVIPVIRACDDLDGSGVPGAVGVASACARRDGR